MDRDWLIFSKDPLLMNAFNTVNVAAACIMTTAGLASKLSIPQDRWVYPLGGAGTQDSSNCKPWTQLQGRLLNLLTSQFGSAQTSFPARPSPGLWMQH
jgi:hypothetical protein